MNNNVFTIQGFKLVNKQKAWSSDTFHHKVPALLYKNEMNGYWKTLKSVEI